jgi:hypothetical protein
MTSLPFKAINRIVEKLSFLRDVTCLGVSPPRTRVLPVARRPSLAAASLSPCMATTRQ